VATYGTDDDFRDDYTMAELGFGQNGSSSSPVQGAGMIPTCSKSATGGMTGDEYRTHMSLWCILAAPLIAGNNLTAMDAETRDILTNPELIAVDQDRLGIQGNRVKKDASRCV